MDVDTFVSKLGYTIGSDAKRDGQDILIVCPFHNDHKPSLRVYGGRSHEGYHCFSCGANGTWPHLYKEVRNCGWKEAYEELGMEFRPEDAPKKEHIAFETVERPVYPELFQRAYDSCVSLPEPARAFLSKKMILDTALELGWRWSEKRKAIVIPYFENGKVVTCRFRDYIKKPDGSMGFDKPKSSPPINGKSIPSRPLYLLREGDETVAWVEGESDALTLYQLGLSVMCTPGCKMKKCLNTMALVAEQSGFKKVICCGDNDDAGRQMNDLSRIAVSALTSMDFEVLPQETYCGLNDLNDVLVAGKLKIEINPIEKVIPGATPLAGWEAIYAQAQFSTKEELYALVSDECAKWADKYPEDCKFLCAMYADSMDELKKAWVTGTVEQQLRYELLKDTMKILLAPAPPPVQQSMFTKYD